MRAGREVCQHLLVIQPAGGWNLVFRVVNSFSDGHPWPAHSWPCSASPRLGEVSHKRRKERVTFAAAHNTLVALHNSFCADAGLGMLF